MSQNLCWKETTTIFHNTYYEVKFHFQIKCRLHLKLLYQGHQGHH